MDIATQNTILEIFPSELIAVILAMLDYRDLASCMQVCKRILDLIGKSSSLQYHLELGKACMEDGPPGGMSTDERRKRLQAHVDAWRNLRWSSCVHLFDLPHNTVLTSVLPGGILAFLLYSECKIKFVQLPSNLRGIAMRQWELTFSFPPFVFSLDPSEDILVVLQSEIWRVHFLSLRSGEPHPLAADFTLSDPPPSLRQSAHLQLLVAGNYVAALLSTYELTVCDWKAGQTVLYIASSVILSMAFLPENRILVASSCATELVCHPVPDSIAGSPVLAVFNLHTIPLTGDQQVTQIPVVILALELGRDIIPTDMHLHYRPNTHSYSPGVAVPFFSSPTDHIIALETTNHLRFPYSRDLIPLRQIVLIPIAKLLYYVGAAEKKGTCCVLEWNDWGATGICRVPAPRPSLCRNAVSGSRFIPHPRPSNVIDVWDFSRAQARAAQPQTSVSESILCARKEVALQAGISGSVTAALSEDAIVIHEASSPIRGEREDPSSRLLRYSSAGVKQGAFGRAALLIHAHLAVPAAWWSCISKKWGQKYRLCAERHEILENQSPVSLKEFYDGCRRRFAAP